MPTRKQLLMALREFLREARSDPIWLTATAIFVAVSYWSTNTLLMKEQHQAEFLQQMDLARNETMELHNQIPMWREGMKGTQLAGQVLSMMSSASLANFGDPAFVQHAAQLTRQAETAVDIATGEQPPDSQVRQLNLMKIDFLNVLGCYQRFLAQLDHFLNSLVVIPKDQIPKAVEELRHGLKPFSICTASGRARGARAQEWFREANVQWEHQMAMYRSQQRLNYRHELAALLGIAYMEGYVLCLVIGWQNRLQKMLRVESPGEL